MDPLSLPDDLVEVAEKELGETQARRTQCMAELRVKLETTGKTLHRKDAAYLLMFLRWAKFNVDKAVKRLMAMEGWIKNHFAIVGDYQSFRAEEFREFYRIGFMPAIAARTSDTQSFVMALMPKKLKPGDVKDPNIMLKWSMWTLNHAVSDPYLQVGGQLIIETFEGMSFFEAASFGRGIIPPSIMKANMSFMSDCAPFRLRGIWIFHQGLVVNILLAIVRPFLSAKMKKRIRAFGADFSELHSIVDPTRLPVEFQGSSKEGGWEWFESMKAKEDQQLKQIHVDA